VQITETVVDSDSLEFIFKKDKNDTKNVLNEALKLYEEDLKSRALEEELLLVATRENAVLVAVMLFRVIVFVICKTFNNKEISEVNETKIKSICELATLKAYYHNVAKYTKDKDSGISGLGEKDREFWIEYEGYVIIRIDMEKVSMVLKDEHITITMPHAKVLDTNISTTGEDMRIIESSDVFL